MSKYTPDQKGFEQFAKHQCDLTPYQPPTYANKLTEEAWSAWKSGSKIRLMREGRLRESEAHKETFFGNHIREAIKEFKSFFK